MNKNLIIGALAITAIYLYLQSQKNASGYLNPGKDVVKQPIKPERMAGLNLFNVHKVV